MMRRLFDVVVRPTVLYGCEVWAQACSLAMILQLEDMLHLNSILPPAPMGSARASRPTFFGGSMREGHGLFLLVHAYAAWLHLSQQPKKHYSVMLLDS